MMYTFNFLISLNHVLKSQNLCFILHYYNFSFCFALTYSFILWKINITLFPSLADAGYLTTVTVQHTIFNERCSSASLECPYNIRQSPGIRPQPPQQFPPQQLPPQQFPTQQLPQQQFPPQQLPPQQLPPPQQFPTQQYIGKFEIQGRNITFSVIKSIIYVLIYIYIYIHTHSHTYIIRLNCWTINAI